MTASDNASVTTIADIGIDALAALFRPWGLDVELRPGESTLPGSYWGEPEAGLVANRLYVRPDTPVHSALHEGCHWICMDRERRDGLHTDAGGDDLEEAAVCYLQILLADELTNVGRPRLQRDMDAWGYSFRLGSTRAWFEEDARDAREWLAEHGLIDGNGRITGRPRA